MQRKRIITGLLRGAMAAGLVATLAACDGRSGSIEIPPASVALSGSIAIESGTRVDIDDADTLALSSTPFAGLQSLPREFVLAGFVSANPGVYSAVGPRSGNAYPADPSDSFALTMQAKQSIYLQPFATTEGPSPLTMTLFSGDRVVGTVSTGVESAPVRLSLPDTEPSGQYTLKVEALGQKPMLYILSTTVQGPVQSTTFRWPDHDFAVAEAVVAFRRGASLMGAKALAADAEMARELAPGTWLVKTPVQTTRMSAASAKATTLEWIHSLRKRPDVVSATPNYIARAMQTPVNEPLYNNPSSGQQWHYELINAPVAWQIAGSGGQGVTVAVMDTGVYGAPGNWHSELNGNIVGGRDFVPAVHDNNPSDPGNAIGTSVYHGTHVAGTIAAEVNGRGGAGIAYNASLVPLRVLGEGGTGTSADLLEALNWVANPGGSKPRADIVNMSLGGLPFQPQLRKAIDAGIERGVVYVAAAGNSGSTTASYPAAYNKVFSVSAVDGAGVLAGYSNYGDWIDIAAPGGDASRDGNADGHSDLISSTSASVINGTLQETYIGLQGTSMAAPHVSGVFALMKSLNPALNHAQLSSYLMAGELTRQDCGNVSCPRTRELGFGLLDAGKSALAASGAQVPGLLTPSPAIVTLSSEAALSASVALKLYGSTSGSATIESVSFDVPWAQLDSAPANSDSGSEFTIRLSLLPDKLEAGLSARAPLVVIYRSDELRRLEIPVIGQRVTDQQARDAGRHFVLLVDPEPEGDFYTTVAQTTAVVENGRYSFVFVPDDGVEPKKLNEVPPGNYILVAGSDLDNNGLICHPGEACAEYPIAGLREEVAIRPGVPVNGIEMTTSYTRPAISATSPDMLPRPGFKGYRLIQERGEPGSGSELSPKRIGAKN